MTELTPCPLGAFRLNSHETETDSKCLDGVERS
jgi:hypothetical protein